MPITTVLFDLDDTLLIEEESLHLALYAAAGVARDRRGVDARALAETARRIADALWLESPTHPRCHELGISATEGLCSSFPGGGDDLELLRSWLPEYQRTVWTQGLEALGIRDADLAEELADAYRQHRRSRQVVSPEAVPVLSQLQGVYRLGIVTNGPADLQSDKLKCTGLERYFEVIAISGKAGVGKPEPGIFELALEVLESDPDQTVMVGDNPQRDVLGALRTGICPVWLNPHGHRLSENERLECEQITKLSDLLALLAQAASDERGRSA